MCPVPVVRSDNELVIARFTEAKLPTCHNHVVNIHHKSCSEQDLCEQLHHVIKSYNHRWHLVLVLVGYYSDKAGSRMTSEVLWPRTVTRTFDGTDTDPGWSPALFICYIRSKKSHFGRTTAVLLWEGCLSLENGSYESTPLIGFEIVAEDFTVFLICDIWENVLEWNLIHSLDMIFLLIA